MACAIQSNFRPETSCTQKQGYCTLKSECPFGLFEESFDLCPNQKSEGAICCKASSIPSDEINCYQEGMDCVDPNICHGVRNVGRKGCKKGLTCCFLKNN